MPYSDARGFFGDKSKRFVIYSMNEITIRFYSDFDEFESK